MNKRKIAQNLHARVRLCPTAQRRDAGGVLLPTIDDDWIISHVRDDGVVEIQNARTDHVAILSVDRIHHFEHEPHRDCDGLRHGMLELRVQLVLRPRGLDYLPLPTFRPRRARRPDRPRPETAHGVGGEVAE